MSMRHMKGLTSKRNKEFIICHHPLKVCFVHTMRLGPRRSHRGSWFERAQTWGVLVPRVGGGRVQEGRASRDQAEPRLEEMGWWWYWSQAGLHTELNGVWQTQVLTSKGYIVVRGLKSVEYSFANIGAWWFEHKSPGSVWECTENIHWFIHTFIHAFKKNILSIELGTDDTIINKTDRASALIELVVLDTNGKGWFDYSGGQWYYRMKEDPCSVTWPECKFSKQRGKSSRAGNNYNGLCACSSFGSSEKQPV